MQTMIEIAEAVRKGRRRAADVLEECLAAIAQLNPALNAFVHLDHEQARHDANRIDAAVAAGRDPGPLAGVPFGVKDLEDCAGMPTSHGSILYKGGTPVAADAPHIARLKAAGAVAIGKTAASEFGMDSATTTKAWGTTRNPWNPARTPGGRSGGSAAAVAAGMVPFATGSDGGGSVRSPAAFCGLVGIKPTHGRIARPSGDSDTSTLGGLTTTVADTARMLDVLSGPDDRDRMSLPAPAICYERAIEEAPPPGLRAAWSQDLGYAPVEKEVAALARAAAETLSRAAGIQLGAEPLRFTNSSAVWLALACAQLKWRLEFDGFWPARAGELCDLTRWAANYGARVTLRDFMAAQDSRAHLEREVAAHFSRFDLLLTPTVACAAFTAEGPIPDVIDGRDASLTGAEPFTMLANLSWIPAISVPAGLTRQGLPVGLQIMARRGRDDLVLQLARMLEVAVPWPRLAPSLSP